MPDSPSTSDLMPRRGRRIRRFLAVFSAALVLLVAAALLFLHTSPARRFVVSQVTQLLQQQHISFAADELSYNLLNLRLALRNVSIRSQDAPDLPPFAHIDRISVDLSLASLLRRRYVVQSGEAEGVAIHYLSDANGRDNVPRPPHDPEQPAEPLNYLIEELHIQNARVRYESHAQGIEVDVPVTSMDVEGHALADRHTIRVAAGPGAIVVQDRKGTLDALNGVIDLGDDDLTLERVELSAEGMRVEATGRIRRFADPQGDLEIHGTADAARAAAIAGLDDPPSGALAVDIRVKGSLAAPHIEGRLEATNAAYRNLSGLQLDTSAAYDIAARRIAFSGLRVQGPFGQVSGRGVLSLNEGDASTLTATVSALDAAALMRAFELPYVVASRVDANVQADWPGIDYLRATGSATATLTPTMGRPARSVIPVSGRIDVTSRANDIDVKLTRMQTAGAEANGTIHVVDREHVDGAARIHVAEVSRAAAFADVVLGQRPGTLLPARVAGAIETTARIGGTVSAPTVTARVTAPALSVGTAEGVILTSDLTYTPSLVTLHALDVRRQQAHAHAAGTIALARGRTLDLSFDAESVDIAQVLDALDESDLPASGTLVVHGRVGGTTTQPTVTATVEGADLVAYGEPWGSLKAKVGLARRTVTVADFVIDKQPAGNGLIKGTASYELDSRTYTVDLASNAVELTGLTLPDGRQVRGTVRLNARAAGSIDDPAGAATMSADALRLDDVAVGKLDVKAALANRQAAITAAAPAFGVTADARIATYPPYAATGTARIDNLQLASLPLNLQTPLEGQLTATVDGSADLGGEGEVADTLQATARVASFAGAWNGQPFKIEGPALLRYAQQRLAIDEMRLMAQDSSIAIKGELPLTERGVPGAISVDARANLATLARYAPAGTIVTASGDLALTGTVRGSLTSIDPDLVLVLNRGAIATSQLQPGFTNMTLRTRVAGGEALVEQLNANWGVATITATGRIPLETLPTLPVEIPRRGGPATFTAHVDGLDLSQLPGAPEGLSGRVSLQAEMAAKRADLAALEGAITFPELQLAFKGLTLNQSQPSRIELSAGVARVREFALAGSVGNLAATGTVALTGDRSIDVDAKGTLNVAVVSLFTDVVRAEGDSTLNIAARGTIAEPELNGFVDLTDATFAVDEPTIAAENVNARLDLAGRRVTVSTLTGALNGGALKGSGFIELGAGGIADAALELTTDDVAFDTPLDLRSLSDARIRLSKRGDEFVVDGQLTLDEAGLTGDINFDEGLLAAMQARRRLDLTEQRNPFLERVRFNLDIDTASPILVDNNLARAEVTADLRLLGSPYEPGMSGRLTVTEESEITLNERRYQVERGVITFLGERRILPSVDLLLNTSARNYDVTIAVTGTPGDTETSLTSDPTLPEPDIMALLVTGRTLEEMRGEEFEVAREQLLSYLAGRVGSQLGRGLERATGLSTVRIEPQLIANEADPSARLTIGQELTDQLELVYSTNLTDSNDQIWVANFDVTRRFQTRGVRQNDNSYRFDIRHDVRIGGRPAPRRLERQHSEVNALHVTGDNRIPEAELRQLFDLEPGDAYNFFTVRNAVEALEETLEERGRLQSRARVQREGNAAQVDVTLRVAAGPRVEIIFDGATPPGRVVDDVRTRWRRGVFDTQRIDDGVDVLRGWLMRDKYLKPTVEGSVEEVDADHRIVRFRIEPGPRFAKMILAFEGASGVAPSELDKIIEEQDLEQQVFTDPTQVTELLERYYREQGYLVADVAAPRYEFDGPTARVVLEVAEGPRFVVGDVTTTGNTVLASDALLSALPVQPADPFLPFAAENALTAIRDTYWRRGFNDVHTDYALALDRDRGRVDVQFEVGEGPRSIISAINVQGNDETSERLVREQLEIQPAQPLDLAALARSRKNLYDTRAFSVVDITREEPDVAAAEKPVTLNVTVREVQPVQLRYGLSYDTERGVGGVFDVSNHNSLGKARVLGVRSRYDGQVREVRGYMTQPSLRYWPIETTGNIYYRVERNRAIDVASTDRFDVDRRGVSIQQERTLADSYVWSWGYRYEHANIVDLSGGSLSERVRVSPLTSTITRETRDDVLDATHGSFSSQAFGYSPSWLGADHSYIKYFGQYFHYFPLQRERRERFTNEILRPRFVFAVAARLGIARGIGTDVPRSERFFAGGSTTLRGFAQNGAGPVDERGLPLGGSMMVVINNELRIPLLSIFDGVLFSDVGNVFPRLSDFSIRDLRQTAGVGLRARTRWFLLRGDYGVILDPRAGERRGRFYFSLGQAF